jgi:4,5-DOPA dioxygenase extradiol
MSLRVMPAMFISHGSPVIAIEPAPAGVFLAALGQELPQPRAILAISAHWETEQPTVSCMQQNTTIHDFYGFPPALYELQYGAPGSPELADRVAELLKEAGHACNFDRQRGLDHGAWIPLRLMYPQADIPVIQLSLQSHLGPAHHWRLGQALVPLRHKGILILGSGSFTHNLRMLDRTNPNGAAPDWVLEFTNWMQNALLDGRVEDLLAYRVMAPWAYENHPTEEHLLPLYAVLGSASQTPRVRRLHHSVAMRTLSMDAYAFE